MTAGFAELSLASTLIPSTESRYAVASARRGTTPRVPTSKAHEEAARILDVLTQLVAPLAATFPADSEVVLHDLRKLPTSIAAIAGDVTGRSIGDPATDVLLEQLHSGQDAVVEYPTVLPNGHEGRSTTVIVRGRGGDPVAALCVNIDISLWRAGYRIFASMLGETLASDVAAVTVSDEQSPQPGGEAFVRSVDELASTLVRQEIAAVGIPVELMKKHHKLQVVSGLERRGMFLLRGAADTVADALEVTRYTVYNYLNEIAADAADTLNEEHDRGTRQGASKPARADTGSGEDDAKAHAASSKARKPH